MTLAQRLSAGLALMTLGTTPLQSQERSIPRDQLPPAVAATAAEHSRQGTVLGYTREQEGGQTYYEVALLVAGRHRDVLIDCSGVVVEIEQELPFDSLPSPAQSALRAKAAGGRIRTVEALTKKGRLVAYEAHLGRGERAREIQVGPKGETLPHEE